MRFTQFIRTQTHRNCIRMIATTNSILQQYSVFGWYCIQTRTRHSWIHYTDCWIV